jgi:16S rRNA (uracil1498-N3)-methyltransferase
LLHRFFISPSYINSPIINLDGETAHQIRTVLRLRPGDEIVVLDNSGLEWQVRLTEVSKNKVQGQITAQKPVQGEPAVQLILHQGTLKGQKFEWILQKGTELGVSGFVPVVCQRSVVRDPEALGKKEKRWQQIIREAAEQSGRGKLPHLEQARSFTEAIQHAQSKGVILMPWEEASGVTLKQALVEAQGDSIALFIGPEGGFTSDEAVLAEQAGATLITLGPRILRAETAGLAVCAAILYEMDEWC